MQLMDWLRDGFLTRWATYRHTDTPADGAAVTQERTDPSGPHDFGHRAHHPDPNAHYAFGDDPTRRMVPPHQNLGAQVLPAASTKNGAAGED